MKNKFIFWVVSVLAVFLIGYSNTFASGGNKTNEQEQILEKSLMVKVLLKKLTIWENPNTGEPTYAVHCRNLSPHSCEDQMEKLVDYIYEVSTDNDLDPWLMAAIAWHESRFNPFVLGPVEEAGIFQINPRSSKARGMKFVHRRWYRIKCRREVGACQKPIVEKSAEILVSSIEQCDTVWHSLRMYNSGSCDGPRHYPNKVFWIKKKMQRMADNIN